MYERISPFPSLPFSSPPPSPPVERAILTSLSPWLVLLAVPPCFRFWQDYEAVRPPPPFSPLLAGWPSPTVPFLSPPPAPPPRASQPAHSYFLCDALGYVRLGARLVLGFWILLERIVPLDGGTKVRVQPSGRRLQGVREED
jgi:hypothetical protein